MGKRRLDLGGAVFLVGLLAGCGPPSTWQGAAPGVSVEVETEPFAIRIQNRRGEDVLRLFDGEGRYGALAAAVDDPEIEPQIIPGWDSYRAREGAWVEGDEPRIEAASNHEVTVRFGRGLEGRVTLRLSDRRVRFEVETEALTTHWAGGRHTKAGVAFHLGPDGRFFGLGGRTATVDHRGWTFYNWCEEGGLGQGEGAVPGPENPYPNGVSMTNFPVPLVHSSEGYLLHLDTPDRSELHLGSERADAWRLAVARNAFAFTVYTDPSPLQNLDLYTRDTGRPLLPAPWVFGPRRRVSRGDRALGEEEWRMLRRRGIPTTSIDDNVHFLPHASHRGQEAELRDWVDTLHRHGFKVMAYNNPYVSLSRPGAAEDRAYGIENGLFLGDRRGRVAETFLVSGSPQTVAHIDLTRPAGQAWFQSLLRRTLDLGYDGWMHDFGEYVERDWRAGDGRRGDELHNVYPVLSARTAHELLERERPGDFHFHVRSGYAGTQGYVPAVWNGDPEATFDPTQGLPASLFAGVNISMSGIAYWGSDISGFKCYTDDPRDREMYLRWAQFGAVSPIMQSQGACAYLTGRRQKWRLWDDDETIQVYGDMARLHTRLQPYFSLLAREAHETGAPLMRHPFLLFPRHPSAWSVREAFFLGDAIYAAPVVRRGDREKTVWLPPGDYLDWSEGRAYVGDQVVTVPAPLDRLPLFLVANRIVPLLDPSIETLAEASVPDVVTPSDVADRLDAVAFVTSGATGRTLEDGTELRIEVLAAPAGDPPPGFRAIEPGTEAGTIGSCARCFVREPPGDDRMGRLRITTALARSSDLRFGPFRLVHRSNRPMRVRWDLHYPDDVAGR